MESVPKPAQVILILCCSTTGACTSLGYYAQSISGHVEILLKQKSSSDLIADNNIAPSLRDKLIAITDILDFAHQQLNLPDNGSYRNYADLSRPYVVWNVFAAPELSMQAKQWCYLIVGCLNYRGYFSQPEAADYAHTLEQSGWEVYTGGVTAYSTLGWFRDPVISTMLNRETWELARLIFHELAHQYIYIENDTDFNEAFADAVALIGLERWLRTQPLAIKQDIETMLAREDQFIKLVLGARDELIMVYDSALPEQDKRREKSRIIAGLEQDYRDLKAGWENFSYYDNWIDSGINNAKLSALSTYRSLVPYFHLIYKNAGSDLGLFYASIEVLADCEKEQRILKLRQSGPILACPP